MTIEGCQPGDLVSPIWSPDEGVCVFVESFDPTAELASTICPRCRHVGLLADEVDSAPEGQRREPKFIMLPSLTVRCPSCNTVTEWLACTFAE